MILYIVEVRGNKYSRKLKIVDYITGGTYFEAYAYFNKDTKLPLKKFTLTNMDIINSLNPTKIIIIKEQ